VQCVWKRPQVRLVLEGEASSQCQLARGDVAQAGSRLQSDGDARADVGDANEASVEVLVKGDLWKLTMGRGWMAG
jgi:hypothetical protein